MRKILLTSSIILAGLSAGYARGMHSIGIIEPPQRRRFSPLGGGAASDRYSV
jgi:hypothetical protein